MQTIPTTYIAKFKLGDNIAHNLDALGVLYRCFELSSSKEKGLLCKPIIVMIGSVAEAVLFDFDHRIRTHTIEGVPNIPVKILRELRKANRKDRFGELIGKMEARHVFGKKRKPNIYTELRDLKALRNRIHIQNTDDSFEKDECDAFNETRKENAEKVLERLIKGMSKRFPRPEGARHVRDFVLPWPAHYIDLD
jgi:hypothetical protein